MVLVLKESRMRGSTFVEWRGGLTITIHGSRVHGVLTEVLCQGLGGSFRAFPFVFTLSLFAFTDTIYMGITGKKHFCNPSNFLIMLNYLRENFPYFLLCDTIVLYIQIFWDLRSSCKHMFDSDIIPPSRNG